MASRRGWACPTSCWTESPGGCPRRPPLPEAERLVPVRVFVRPETAQAIRAIGTAEARAVLERHYGLDAENVEPKY